MGTLLQPLASWAQTTISSVSPTAGPAGTAVTISGSGFAPTASQNAVLFGAARATVTAATATQLTVTVPVGAASVAPVTVSNLSTQRLGSSLNSATPFFTVRFAGPALNPASYQATAYPLASSRIGPGALATADLNADNTPDFALVADGVLRLLLSNGQGGYDPAIQLSAGLAPGFVKTADVDANGAPDILVGASGELLLFQNLGNGNGFATAASLGLGGQTLGSFNFNTISTNVEVADVTADGRPDVLTLTTSTAPLENRLVLLRNNGTGFDAPQVLLTGRLQGPLVADFNQDGRLDVLAIGERTQSGADARLLLLTASATGTGFDAPLVTTLTGAATFARPLLADINADGQPDVVFAGQVNNSNELLAALRTATGFTLQTLAVTGASLQAIADADGDGRPDVLTTAGGSFAVYRGLAAGGLAAPISYAGAGQLLVEADFTADGRSDVATFDLQSGSLAVFRYTGAGPNQNNSPTLNALPNLTLNEDDPVQTVALSGISNGGDAGQAVTLTAVSSDPNLVPTPTISYFSPTTTGTLRLQPAPDAFGTCTITVTASDGQPQNGTISRTFTVTVNPVNDVPTLDPIPDVVVTTLTNGQANVVVPLSGITSGAANEAQTLVLSSFVLLANGGLLSNGNIGYTSPATTGQYTLQAAPTGPGLYATVTLTVNDGQTTNNTLSRTFRIFYQPGGSQAGAPTLDPIADITANRALATQLPVLLTGISDGDPNQVLPTTVTAVSSDPTLVTPGAVNYTSPGTTGSLPYSISATRAGTATVTVTVSNGQSTNGTLVRSFRITVPQVLSTEPASTAATLELYPNPAPGGRFHLKSNTPGPADVTVTDLAGRVVLRRRLESLGVAQTFELPNVPAGVYLVQVRMARVTLVRRMQLE